MVAYGYIQGVKKKKQKQNDGQNERCDRKTQPRS